MWASIRIAIVAAVAIAATGCKVGDTGTPPDGGGGGGLSVVWNGQPTTIPSEPSSDMTIDRAVFHLDGLRVVGDAGTFPLDRDKLEWSRGIVPTAVLVTGASPGLYSRLLFGLEGDTEDGKTQYAYEITGTVKVNGSFQPFTVHDTAELNVMLDFSIMLPAGGIATIPVRLEIDKMVSIVNFSSVPMQDGRYLVESTSPQISAVRAAVKSAVGIHDLE